MKTTLFLMGLLIIPFVSAGITQTYKESCLENGYSDWVAHVNIRNGVVDKVTNNFDYDIEISSQGNKHFFSSTHGLYPLREHERISSNSFSFDGLDRDRVLICLDNSVELRIAEVPEYDLLAIPLILSVCLVGVYWRRK